MKGRLREMIVEQRQSFLRFVRTNVGGHERREVGDGWSLLSSGLKRCDGFLGAILIYEQRS